MMKKKNLVEYIAVGITALILPILNQLHVITQWMSSPSDRTFIGIAHYFADFFLYLGYMTQGEHGSLLANHPFTNEPMRPTWFYWFNTGIGFIGARFGLPSYTSYNIALFIFVMLLIIAWYIDTRVLFPKSTGKRLTAFYFILTATSFIDIGNWIDTGNITLLGQFWLTPGPALNRLGGVPHQIFQTLTLLSFMMALSWLLSKKSYTWKHYLGMLILTFFAATSNPLHMLLVGTGVTAAVVWRTVQKKRWNTSQWTLFGTIALVALILIWLTSQEFNVPVYANAKTWELNNSRPPTLMGYLLTLGPIVLLAPFGVMSFFKKGKLLHHFLLFYGFLTVVLLLSPVPGLIGAAPARMLHPTQHALFAILAAEGVFVIASWLAKATKMLQPRTYILAIVMLYSILTIPAFWMLVTARANPAIQNSVMLLTTEYNHVPQETADAFAFLLDQPTDLERPVVLMDSQWRYEVLVPVLANKVSFSGHPIHTLFYEDKERLRDEFYAGFWSEEQVQAFLDNHRIGYVVVSPTTGATDYVSGLPMLQEIYASPTVNIYKAL